MPGYGQNTKIPVTPRTPRAPVATPSARTINTPGRQPNSTRPVNATPTTSRPRTLTKSKPISGSAAGSRPPAEANPEAVSAGTQKPESSNPPATAPPAQGSYGQRYSALRQATTTSGYPRPQGPPQENSKKKMATSSNPLVNRQPGKPLVSDAGPTRLHLPLRPHTVSHPRSKKAMTNQHPHQHQQQQQQANKVLCKRPIVEDENANSNMNIDVTKAGTVEFPPAPKAKKTRSVSRKAKRSVSNVSKSSGNSNQSSNDSTVAPRETIENLNSLKVEGERPQSSIVQIKGDSKMSILSEASKMSVSPEGQQHRQSSIMQVTPTVDSAAVFKDLPNLHLYDVNLSPGYGPSVHIESNAGSSNQSALGLPNLPEYTLKPPTLSTSKKHIEVFDGISIEDMTPPAELHQVVSDPKLPEVPGPDSPHESITEMTEPTLVGSASEESLPGEVAAAASSVSSKASYKAHLTISAGKSVELDKLAQGPNANFIPPEDNFPGPSSSLVVSNEREDIRGARSGASSAAYDIPSVSTAPLMISQKGQLSVTGPPSSLVSPELNCYEINPLEKYEHLGTVVRIPRQITLTKDIPPLYVGTFPIENNSNEDLIFKVKTKTETANIYAITPKLGTLIKNSSMEIKVQADFTKGLSPSLDMTRKNMVVLLSNAPKSKMTRKDLEHFWKLLQEQQDDGKSSFYIHSIENIHVTDLSGNSVLKEKKSTAAVAKKPAVPLLPTQDDPRLAPIPEAATGDLTREPLAAPSNIVNANDVVVPEESAAALPPSFDEIYSAELTDAVTEDVRSMTGSMNSMLRWGSIAIYVSSLAGIMILLYHNMKDASGIPEGNNKGFMNMFSSADKKEPQ